MDGIQLKENTENTDPNGKKEVKESCCCEKKEVKESCCSEKKEVKESCCSEKKEVKESCCSEKEEVKQSCCSSGQKDDCCSVVKDSSCGDGEDECCGEKDSCSSAAAIGTNTVTVEIPLGSKVSRVYIKGMTCTGCSSRVENHFKTLTGVNFATLSFATSSGDFYYNEKIFSEKILIQNIELLGFTGQIIPTDNLPRLYFSAFRHVKSKTTKAASVINTSNYSTHSIKTQLSSLNGVSNVEVTNEAKDKRDFVITFNSKIVGARTIRNAFDKFTNYEFDLSSFKTLMNVVEKNDVNSFALKKKLLLFTFVMCLPIIFVGFISPSIPLANDWLAIQIINKLPISALIMILFATPIQIVTGKPIYIMAYKSLLYEKKMDMDVLIALSSSIAYLYSLIECIILIIGGAGSSTVTASFFETAPMLLLLISLGRFFESMASSQSQKSLTALLDAKNEECFLIEKEKEGNLDLEADDKKNQKVSSISIFLLEMGDLVQIPPFASFPCDGIIFDGETLVNESLLTGESLPVFKKANDSVYGTSINGDSSVIFQVTRLPHESLISDIYRLVEENQAKRATIQGTADYVASLFTPFIIIISTLSFFIWFSLAYTGTVNSNGDLPVVFALKFALSLLVVSCPCAIALAVPTAILVSSSVGAKNGVLFKGGDAIEKLGKCGSFIFDKTGTLTSGKFNVVEIIAAENFKVDQLLYYTASLESFTSHPLAKSIVEYSKDVILSQEVVKSKEFSGEGVSGIVDGDTVYVGKRDWVVSKLNSHGENDLFLTQIQSKKQNLGCTEIFVSINGNLAGALFLSSEIKKEAVDVINYLRKKDKDVQFYILSGDNQESVNYVCDKLNLVKANAKGNVMPVEKGEFVKSIKENSKAPVCFLGDGVNDSAALSISDVGIAIGSGTKIIQDAANLVLVNSSLTSFLFAHELSLATMKQIKLNFLWAFVYNLIAISLASGIFYNNFDVYIPPSFAGISELLSSVPVVLFSLSLSQFRMKKYV